MTVSRRVLALGLSGVLSLPVLVALGSRNAGQAEIETLRAENESLALENASFREATGELTEQIAALQTALNELGDQAELDPATRRAIDRLPAGVRSRAVGGPSLADLTKSAPASITPESTFDVLRGLLGSLEDRLTSVKTRIEGQQALARATPTIWPVIGRLSSYYGNRKDPFTGGPDFHTGLDIGANHGAPVRATADGVVESAGYNGNYGNAILLSHGFGIGTRFGHLSRFAVRPGQQVKRGDVIGYVGSTGRATSSHLHYEILLSGRPINPLTLLTRP